MAEYQLDLVPSAAVLFARSDSVYKSFPDLDVYDIHRNALTFSGSCPVIAHPPCRAWGRLRGFANPRPGEKELGLFAVDQVRNLGGVLEHPAGSSLWQAAELPLPGERDFFGGYTLPIDQYSFGHRARKFTWLYILGVSPADLPPIPFSLGYPAYIIGSSGRRTDGTRLKKGEIGYRPEVSKAEREHTPYDLAVWLRSVAVLVTPPLSLMGETIHTNQGDFPC